MAIDPLYIPLFTIEEVILDKDTGLPLSGGTVSFYRDSQNATPKQVYQIAGNTPNYTFLQVGSSLTLGISGTFVDNNGNPFVPYAYPYDDQGNVDLYYVVVTSAGGVQQFVRKAVPYVNIASIPPEQRSNTENELCNPQFVEVLFPSTGTTTLNVTGTNTVTPVAPGWDIISSGSGTLTLQRLEPTAAGVPTNPPYALSIQASSGFGASITLRQRLTNSPSLMRGGYASGSLCAAVISGGASSLSMVYAPDSGTPTTIITSTLLNTDGNYHSVVGNAAIGQQGNTAASVGYLDINIIIPTQRTIALTSIQVVGVGYSIDIPFDEQSADRQKDQLFHYYENSAVHQPKDNLLTGWVFAQNPYQFKSSSLTDVADTAGTIAKCAYTIDQTIIYQQSGSGNLLTGYSTRNNDGGYEITPKDGAGAGATQFAMIQYIDPATIHAYWGNVLSVLARARIFTSHGTQVGLKARLIWRTTLPAIIGASEPISGWTYQGDPTFQTGWTAVTPLNDPTYILQNNYSGEGIQTYPSMQFNQFSLPASSSNTTMTLGIVLYTTTAMDATIGTKDSIVFDRASLVPNSFAVDATPMTFDESLIKCQRYYQKSFLTGTVPAQNAGVDTGESVAPQTSVANQAGSPGIIVRFYPPMCITPNVVLYNPANTNAEMRNITHASDFSATAKAGITTKSFYATGTTPGGSDIGNVIAAHWTADARLGLS